MVFENYVGDYLYCYIHCLRKFSVAFYTGHHLPRGRDRAVRVRPLIGRAIHADREVLQNCDLLVSFTSAILTANHYAVCVVGFLQGRLHMRRSGSFMTQPQRDDADVHTGLQQMHRRRMPTIYPET